MLLISFEISESVHICICIKAYFYVRFVLSMTSWKYPLSMPLSKKKKRRERERSKKSFCNLLLRPEQRYLVETALKIELYILRVHENLCILRGRPMRC